MKILSLCLLVFFLQELPLKPKEAFDIQLDYKFRQRPPSNLASTVNLSETVADQNRRTSTSLLPYLILEIRLIKLNNETRLRIANNMDSNMATKRISEGEILSLDIGFTADVKDRVTPHHYTLTFLSPKRKETSRIVISIDEDGNFFVNGEKRGRF